ncbi:hypothetical protein B0T18DRAFT_407890 [Schizothecium vesticola]|uniref:Secreted protein n=1 Tax=Schizothecium vesticola TaxID=314040 RepID=A0AA40F2C4_9PEZI|nr:hypothetical protein B0T18DRAFT_407890 [Schizothecium vesticola]
MASVGTMAGELGVPVWLLTTALRFTASVVCSAPEGIRGMTTSGDTFESITTSNKWASISLGPTSTPLVVTEMDVIKCAWRVHNSTRQHYAEAT